MATLKPRRSLAAGTGRGRRAGSRNLSNTSNPISFGLGRKDSAQIGPPPLPSLLFFPGRRRRRFFHFLSSTLTLNLKCAFLSTGADGRIGQTETDEYRTRTHPREEKTATKRNPFFAPHPTSPQRFRA